MPIRHALLLLLLFAALPARAFDPTEEELIRLETSKWDPASLLHPLELMSLFSDDMLSIDYGTDLQGGAERRNWAQILAFGQPPSWKMKLDGWKVVRPTADTVILSYRVAGISVEWKGYATSVWARRDGRWKTVFYQASTAK